MNDRRLRLKLQLIAGLAVPLPFSMSVSACGGNAEGTGWAGSPSTGGITGTGGIESAGGSGSGAGGRVGSGGAGGSGGTNGGAIGSGGTNGGATGTGDTCMALPHDGTGSNCVNPTLWELDASCEVVNPTRDQCLKLCNSSWALSPCSFSPGSTPNRVMLLCPPTCVAGRRPAGFAETEVVGSGLVAYLARAAELEAAAVPAFRRLRAELSALRAPRPLLRALSRAARDERRHTRATRALARRHGALVSDPRIAPVGARSLEAIALENMREGCVRELYGALLATFQAEHAREPELRRLMRRIAHEETRHAGLSLRVQRWLEQRLDGAARSRVRSARKRALFELSQELERAVEPVLCESAGLPSREQARQLFAALFAA